MNRAQSLTAPVPAIRLLQKQETFAATSTSSAGFTPSGVQGRHVAVRTRSEASPCAEGCQPSSPGCVQLWGTSGPLGLCKVRRWRPSPQSSVWIPEHSRAETSKSLVDPGHLGTGRIGQITRKKVSVLHFGCGFLNPYKIWALLRGILFNCNMKILICYYLLWSA